MKKPVFIVLVLFMIGLGASAVEDEAIHNVFPDVDRSQDTTVIYEVQVDSSTDITANLYFELPNGSTQFIDSQSATAKAPSQVFDFTIDGSRIKQFGSYTIIANETTSGESSNLTVDVFPNIRMHSNWDSEIEVNGDSDFFTFSMHLDAVDGVKVPTEDVYTNNVTVYNITGESDSVKYKEYNLTYDLKTDSLRSRIPEDDFQKGSYLAVANWYYQSGSNTQKFYNNMTFNFNVRKDYDREIYTDKWGNITATQIDSTTSSTLNDTSTLLEDRWGERSAASLDDSIDDSNNELRDVINSRFLSVRDMVSLGGNISIVVVLISVLVGLQLLIILLLLADLR